MNDDLPESTGNGEPSNSETIPTDTPQKSSQTSGLLFTISFIIVVLLGIVIFQNLIPRQTPKTAKSPAVESLRADIQTRRAELNRKRIELGMQPLAGSSEIESTRLVAERLTKDARKLASIVASFEDLLARKELELDDARDESIASLQQQKRLRDQLVQANTQLRKALVDASLSDTLQGELNRAEKRIAELSSEVEQLRPQPEKLQLQLEESRMLRQQLEARVRELEQRLRQATLFAESEKELFKEAVALFRALRKLEGANATELEAAYSRFGAELNAEVLDTCRFETGSAKVDPALEQRLSQTPAEVPPGALLLVVGYASETGDVHANQKLSSDRATAVARLLDRVSVDERQVQAVFLGQTSRFGPNQPKANQRVEVWQIRQPTETPSPAGETSRPEDPGTPPLRPIPEFR